MDKEKRLSEPEFNSEGFTGYKFKDRAYKLWYGKIGSGSLAPVLVLHGGPGGNHHNLVAFQALADERPLIFYDQLGCGKSDRPNDDSLWTASRYFDEVRAVRDELGLKEYHLIGHSWGTMLAVGFGFRHPEGIISLSLHSPILSFPYYINNVAVGLKQGLANNAGEVIDNYELKGRGEKSNYEQACLEFTKKHVTQTWPLPEAMKKLIAARNSAVHEVMVKSDSELNVLGNLKTMDVTKELTDINVPALMTCGEDDLCTPAFTKWQAGFSKDVRVKVIKDSAHMTPIDNPQELIKIQRHFLKEVGL